VVPPGRHVSGRLTPRHDIVEVLIDRRLAERLPVGEIADPEHERRSVGCDLVLVGGYVGVVEGAADIGFDVKPEAARGSGVECLVGPTTDGVVVGGSGTQAGQSRLPERPARRDGRRVRG
jgi:hypothetical protein